MTSTFMVVGFVFIIKGFSPIKFILSCRYGQLDQRGAQPASSRPLNRATNPSADYPYPAEIIRHAVWLYFRFTLRFRDLEELLAARGIIVTYETIRQWCLQFGQRHYLWRAADQDGQVLDLLLPTRRNQPAAKRFFKKWLKGLRPVPRVVVTDQGRSYGTALKELMPSVEHHQHHSDPRSCSLGGNAHPPVAAIFHGNHQPDPFLARHTARPCCRSRVRA